MSITYRRRRVGKAVGGLLLDRTAPRWDLGSLRRALRCAASPAGCSPASSAARRPRGRACGAGRAVAAAQLDSRGGRPPRLDAGDLAAGVREGDRRALARAISLVENGDPLAYELVATSTRDRPRYSSASPARRASASRASISALVRHVARGAHASASSPSTRRARSRRARCSATGSASPTTSSTRRVHPLDGTRGHLGGLAEATLQALLVLDAAGKDVVFLETVGAGRARSR
jgi:hypothetical protein